MMTKLYLLVQASSFFISVLYYKTLKKTELRYFIPFLFITLIVEILGYWLTTKNIRNYLLYNIFTTFEFIFYAFIFYKNLRKTGFKKTVALFMPLYVAAVIYNLSFGQGMHSFHTITFLLGSFFMVVFCCLYFYESVLPEHLDHELTKQPFFWVCTGLLLFYLGSVIINALFEYLRSFNMQAEGIKIYGLINQSLNIVLYSSFIFAFVLCRNTNKISS